MKPAAYIDNSGHPRHLSYLQGAKERELYGPLRPLFDAEALRRAERSLEAAYNIVCEYSEGRAASEAAQFIHADLEEIRSAIDGVKTHGEIQP